MPRPRRVLILLVPLLVMLVPGLVPGALAAKPPTVPFAVTAKLTPATIAAGATAAVAGKVKPVSDGEQRVVELQVHQANGTWKTVAKGRTTAKAAYKLSWKPPSAGVFKLRVVAPKAGKHKLGTSDVVTLTVVKKTNPVAVQVSPSGQGAYAHTCAVLTDRTVRCWGDNQVGELGNGTITGSSVPVKVTGISNAAEVSSGTEATCALLTTKHVECWGYAANGQMGNGSLTGNTGGGVCTSTVGGTSHSVCDATPVAVSGITDAVSIAVGQHFACAVLSTGSVRCWGYDEDGELGNGFSEPMFTAPTHPGDIEPSPVLVTGVTTAVSISAGYETACVILDDGTLRCWGLGIVGGLGDGVTTYSETGCTGQCSPTAKRVIGETASQQIAYGGIMGCSLEPDHTVDCWGDNTSGNLGQGGTTGPEQCQTAFTGITQDCSSTSVEVHGLTGATEVTSSTYGACALLSSGVVHCWGSNSDGELGDNDTSGANSSSPVAVHGIDDATSISGGTHDVCAVLRGGTIECWGRNDHGQLGNGTTTDAFTPVEVKGIG